jgi:hypothetical protein
MNFAFNNSSIVSVNSGTIVLNVSGKTRTFVDAKLVSAVDGEIVLDLPYTLPTNGAYRTIHLTHSVQRTFISNTSITSLITYYVTQYSGGIKSTGEWGTVGNCRNATPEEIQELNDQLAAEGKRWNPDTMQIEKLKWKPKKRDKYYYIRSKGNVNSAFWHKGSVDIHRYKFGNCFQAKEEAEAKLEQIKQILNR